jgi:hypothetical protein
VVMMNLQRWNKGLSCRHTAEFWVGTGVTKP